MVIELDPVDRITADAVGPAGHRTFYLQGRQGDRLITVLVEKQQVQLLAASVVEILSRVGKETGQGPPEEAMGLEEPIVPEWRAGRLSIGYQEDRDLLLLEAEELLPDESDEDANSEGEVSGDERPEVGETSDPSPGDGEDAGEVARREEVGESGGDADAQDSSFPEEEDEVLAELAEMASRTRPAERVRFWATREQMLSLARHGAAVCARGRPRCRLCGNPLDPEGHICPLLDGHRKAGDA